MQIVIDIPEETYKTISEWKEPNPKYAAEYMLYGFVKNGKRIEQQLCEDAISRTEAIKALEYDLSIEADGGLDKYRTVIKDLLNAIYNTQKKAIEQLPSVSTEKTGHWIRHDNGKYHWYLCSCCDAMAGSDEKMMACKFCPRCGARMGVEE